MVWFPIRTTTHTSWISESKALGSSTQKPAKLKCGPRPHRIHVHAEAELIRRTVSGSGNIAETRSECLTREPSKSRSGRVSLLGRGDVMSRLLRRRGLGNK